MDVAGDPMMAVEMPLRPVRLQDQSVLVIEGLGFHWGTSGIVVSYGEVKIEHIPTLDLPSGPIKDATVIERYALTLLRDALDARLDAIS